MALFWSLLPIVLLIYLMVKPNGMPSFKALPLIALLAYLIKLVIFNFSPTLVHASVLNGLLTAWTPISIVFGAIFLFVSMETTGAMEIIRKWLNHLTPNPVAQLMIVGWAFAFLVEGASGFGTPAAIAAPVLVGMGFKPLRIATFALIMNTVPVSFGAVGTPIWFGLGELGLSASEIADITINTGIIQFFSGLIIPVLGLLFVVKWEEIRRNILYVLASAASCVLPMVAISFLGSEFPSLVGGLVGLLVSVFLAKKGIGLHQEQDNSNEATQDEPLDMSWKTIVKALFPLWATILILIITRIPELGLQPLLRATEPEATFSWGSLGDFSISSSLVITLREIYQTEHSIGTWQHALLYVPSLIPFFLVGGLSFPIFHKSWGDAYESLKTAWHRMIKPIIALSGALVLVKILMLGDAEYDSNTAIIGKVLASYLGEYWQYFAVYLGALGSFFSGSATVSNLTFGDIQLSIAQSTSLNPSIILALQSVGAAMGNMVCIHNIVSVCSVLSIVSEEGNILKKTVRPLIAYGVIATLVALFL